MVVCAGEMPADPVTATLPTPLSIITVVAPLVAQLRVVLCPAAMVAAAALKLPIDGGPAGWSEPATMPLPHPEVKLRKRRKKLKNENLQIFGPVTDIWPRHLEPAAPEVSCSRPTLPKHLLGRKETLRPGRATFTQWMVTKYEWTLPVLSRKP